MTTESNTGGFDPDTFSRHIADVVETAGRSVVRLEARPGRPATGIVWDGGGLVLTADHAIELDEGLEVVDSDDRRRPATIVSRDPASDLALLQVDASGLTAALMRTEHGRVGEVVVSLGRPSGLMASLGIISAVGGRWRTAHGSQLESYIRIDATQYPGFSGGPILSLDGRVVGLNSWTLSRGAGYALGAAALSRLAGALASGGVRRAYLGARVQPVALSQDADGAARAGLLVVELAPNGPASSGLLLGDVLLTADGEALSQPEDLYAMISGRQPGTKVVFGVRRGGVPREQEVTLGERPGGR